MILYKKLEILIKSPYRKLKMLYLYRQYKINNMKTIIYKRNCAVCDTELTTTNKYYFNKAVKENKYCLSCSLTGRKFSEDHRKNLSKNHADVKGENNPFFNKTHTDETKSKISEVVKDKYKDPKLRKKVSEIRKEWHKYNENSFKGKSHTEETKEKMSELTIQRFEDQSERDRISNTMKEWYKNNEHPLQGKSHTEESKFQMSKSQLERFSNIENHPFYGKTHSEETIQKMSKSAIERVIRQGMCVSYNPNSIPIIENYANENGYSIIHAENGGEYQIPGTGFFVDGYDVNNNIVIEYDEKYHSRKIQTKKDKKRQDEIGNILKCKFIRILDDGEIRIFDYSENNKLKR